MADLQPLICDVTQTAGDDLDGSREGARDGSEIELETRARMSKGTLVLSIQGGADNWSPQRWIERFNAVGNGRDAPLHFRDSVGVGDKAWRRPPFDGTAEPRRWFDFGRGGGAHGKPKTGVGRRGIQSRQYRGFSAGPPCMPGIDLLHPSRRAGRVRFRGNPVCAVVAELVDAQR